MSISQATGLGKTILSRLPSVARAFICVKGFFAVLSIPNDVEEARMGTLIVVLGGKKIMPLFTRDAISGNPA